jgi:hypothetical protein
MKIIYQRCNLVVVVDLLLKVEFIFQPFNFHASPIFSNPAFLVFLTDWLLTSIFIKLYTVYINLHGLPFRVLTDDVSALHADSTLSLSTQMHFGCKLMTSQLCMQTLL